MLITMSFLKKSQNVIPECKLCFRSLKPRFPETTVKTCPLLWVLSCRFRYSPGCGGTQQGGADLNSVSKLSCSLILSLDCFPPPSLLKENLQQWEQPFASCKNCIMSYLFSFWFAFPGHLLPPDDPDYTCCGGHVLTLDSLFFCPSVSFPLSLSLSFCLYTHHRFVSGMCPTIWLAHALHMDVA